MHVFETAIGPCGIAWRGEAVTHFHFFPDGATSAPAPKTIAKVVERVQAHLQGDLQDFRDVPLDVSTCPPFARDVYLLTRAIPAGLTRTYGDIAKELGKPGSARAVGQALGRNPIALIIPCHRVLAAGGKWGGFSAPGGLDTKARLLQLEGARL